jgi:hypothetical protein
MRISPVKRKHRSVNLYWMTAIKEEDRVVREDWKPEQEYY